eukprot:746846-Lingulodinium_polyedra.AAC.1
MEITEFLCSCPPGTPHGTAWGNRSVYNSAPGTSSLKLQREVECFRKLFAGVEPARPPWRREARLYQTRPVCFIPQILVRHRRVL